MQEDRICVVFLSRNPLQVWDHNVWLVPSNHCVRDIFVQDCHRNCSKPIQQELQMVRYFMPLKTIYLYKLNHLLPLIEFLTLHNLISFRPKLFFFFFFFFFKSQPYADALNEKKKRQSKIIPNRTPQRSVLNKFSPTSLCNEGLVLSQILKLELGSSREGKYTFSKGRGKAGIYGQRFGANFLAWWSTGIDWLKRCLKTKGANGTKCANMKLVGSNAKSNGYKSRDLRRHAPFLDVVEINLDCWLIDRATNTR